jgi:DNA recombination protein RmuC
MDITTVLIFFVSAAFFLALGFFWARANYLQTAATGNQLINDAERRADLAELKAQTQDTQLSLALQEKQQLDTKLEALRAQHSQAEQKIASLSQQASRVATLEADIKATLEKYDAATGDKSRLGAELSAANSTLTQLNKKIEELKTSCAADTQRLLALTEEKNTLDKQLIEMQTKLEEQALGHQQQSVFVAQANAKMADTFKLMATDIMESTSKKFAEQNSGNLGQILNPLREKLTEFQNKVEQVYGDERVERVKLTDQVKDLMNLNQTLSQEASNLTNALRGSNKTQGSWGEFVLESILEGSGLSKGEQYLVQESMIRDDGSRVQPDVIIKLPESKYLVIDSKVTLISYEEYWSAEEESSQTAALKRYIDSIKSHIKGLSDKRYETLHGAASPDFVLMFLPIESAFALAISKDPEIFKTAWDKNVILVSPSTLMFTLRTVVSIWRQEAQTRNAQDIAARGAELYDKFVGFVTDFEKMGSSVEAAQKAFLEGRKKLSEGRGNLVRQAEMLRDLGVKPTKALPTTLLDASLEAVPLIEQNPQ